MSPVRILGFGAVMLFVTCALSTVSAERDMQDTSQIDLNTMREEIREVLRDLELILEPSNDTMEFDPNGCGCSRLSCRCCQRIRVRRFRINAEACISVTLIPRQLAVELRLTLNGRSLYTKRVSARRIPQLCTGIPFWKRGGSICMQFYNVRLERRRFGMCARIEAKVLYIRVAKLNLGCFRLNFLDSVMPKETSMELPYFDEFGSSETEELPYVEEDNKVVSVEELEQEWAEEYNRM